jgi:hypothetical protein
VKRSSDLAYRENDAYVISWLKKGRKHFLVLAAPAPLLGRASVSAASKHAVVELKQSAALETYTQIAMPRHIEMTRTLLDGAAGRL